MKKQHLRLVKRDDDDDQPLTAVALRERLQVQAAAVTAVADEWAVRDAPVSFKDVEKALREVVFAFARIAIMLFLALREEHLMRTYPSQVEHGGRRFRRAPAISRGLATVFGVVRYARTYMREVGSGQRRGFHPLDVALGLIGDRFSWNVLTMAARLATKLSFAEARGRWRCSCRTRHRPRSSRTPSWVWADTRRHGSSRPRRRKATAMCW